jgi:hypothetical protein
MILNKNIDIPYDEIVAFCERHHVRKLSLFDSVLRDDFAPDSDVDVLVEFEPDAIVGLKFIAMQRELSNLVGREVDPRQQNSENLILGFIPLQIVLILQTENIAHKDTAFIFHRQAAQIALGDSNVAVAQQAADFVNWYAGFLQSARHRTA